MSYDKIDKDKEQKDKGGMRERVYAMRESYVGVGADNNSHKQRTRAS